MSLGLKLRVSDTVKGTSFDRTFDRFPIRIGRNALNDLQLDYPFVSQYHAVIELHGNALMLRDLGSKNGTLLRVGGKMQVNRLEDLADHNYEFVIVALLFKGMRTDNATAPPPKKRRTVSQYLGVEHEELEGDKSDITAVNVMNFAVDAIHEKIGPLYDAYRQAWGSLYESLFKDAGVLDPAARDRLFTRLQAAYPALAHEVDFERLVQPANTPSAVKPRSRSIEKEREEIVALQGIKELARWYLPTAPPLEGVGPVVAFVDKLQETLDVFIKTFIPLREGYKQFETQFALRSSYSTAHTSPGINPIEAASNHHELAKALLDWTNPSTEGPRAIESAFADLMIHQIAMLNGVMVGVNSLLHELSPQAIEKAFDEPGRRRSGGIQIGPYRYKSLWEFYIERHGDFADEEKETFALIFGPQFVQAYRQYAGDASGASFDQVAGSSPAPSAFSQSKYPPPPSKTPASMRGAAKRSGSKPK